MKQIQYEKPKIIKRPDDPRVTKECNPHLMGRVKFGNNKVIRNATRDESRLH